MASPKRPSSPESAADQNPSTPAPLSAEALADYLRSDGTGSTSRTVEQRLIDSQFHADAADGTASATPAAVQTSVAELGKRLENRINHPEKQIVENSPEVPSSTEPAAAPKLAAASRRKRRLLTWLGGTLLSLLLMGGLLANFYTKSVDEEAIAAKRRRAAGLAGEEGQPKGFFESLFSSDEPDPEEVALKRRNDSLAAVTAAAEKARLLALEEQRRQERDDARTARETAAADAAAAARAAAAAAAVAAAPRVERPAEPTVRRMRGQITTDGGVPVAGATVTLRATGRKVSAGADGWYTIEVPIGGDGTMDVEAPGFVQRTTRANADGQANVQLSTAEAVAVRSLASAAAAERRTKIVRPEPAGGYGKYSSYIAGAAKLTTEGRKADVRGNVQVEFQVNTDGTLSNFRVVQGLGYGCDEEAVRVIQDGPQWVPGKSNDEPVTRKVMIPVPFGR